MPLTPEQIEHKFRQQESENLTIYDTLVAIQSKLGEHDERFAALERRLDDHDRRFDGIDARFDGIDGRFDGIDARLDGIDATLAEVLRRLPEPE